MLAALALVLLALAAPASAAAPPPRITSPSAAVFEASTGLPLYGREAGQRRMIASTTKMMTALVAVEALPLSRTCTAPAYAASPLETRVGLRAGERMTVRDLLRALLLPSANDAAAALAVCAAGSRAAFVARMNRRAAALGLRHTRFSTPIGLDDPGNYATAADLVRLAIALRREPFLRGTVDRERAVLASGDRRRTVVNRNALLRTAPWVDGVKTGHTFAAGYVLVASGTREGLTYVAAVLGAPSEAARDDDALALLRWAFASYRVARPVVRGRANARPSVVHRPDDRVAVVARGPLRRLVARDARVRLVVRVPEELEGPLPRGARVGTLVVRAGGRELGRVPLVTAAPVPEVGLPEQVARAILRPGSLVAIVAALGGALVLLARRRNRARRRRVEREAA